MIKSTFISATVLALAAGSGSALAQGNPDSDRQAPPAQPHTMPQQAPAASVEPEKIKKFVGAYTEVQEVRQEFSAQLQEVQDPEKAKSLQEKVQTEMSSAVEDNGLTVQEYQNLANQINQDPDLLAQVQAELSEATQ